MFLALFRKRMIVGKPNTPFGKINLDMLSDGEATVFQIYPCVIVIFIFLKGLEKLNLTVGVIIILTKFLGIWATMAHVKLLCTKDGIDT